MGEHGTVGHSEAHKFRQMAKQNSFNNKKWLPAQIYSY